MEGREDRVRLALLACALEQVVDGVQTGVTHAVDPAGLQGPLDSLDAPAANGPESELKCSSVALAARASSGSSRSGGPRRTDQQPSQPLVEVRAGTRA